MTQLILQQANFLQSGITALINLIKDLRSSRKDISEARKTMKELHKLSDKDLNDIGLCRGDIWNVAHNKTDGLRRRF
ncbi:DUF1127 domain-containing protein [Gammaproteobacteria bacterium]|nr:DUF1127 domain-containing protein [Gammaproteobacteria bacterium]